MSSLEGRRIVVTAPAGSRLSEQLRAQGAEVIECPTIAIADPDSWDEVDSAVQDVLNAKFGWILFTSRNGVDRFLARWGHTGVDTSLSDHASIGAVGAATAARLEDRGIEVELVPDAYTGRVLAASLKRAKEPLDLHPIFRWSGKLKFPFRRRSSRVLAVRGEGAPRHAIEELEKSGWSVRDVGAYRTVPGEPDQHVVDAVRAGEFDAIAFTSGSTARNFVDLVDSPEKVGLGRGQESPVVACIGPETASVADAAGFRVGLIADPHSNEGLVQALLAHFAAR